MLRSRSVLFGCLAAFACFGFYENLRPDRVGDRSAKGLVIPVGAPIQPAGTTVSIPHRPTQVLYRSTGSLALVLDESAVDLFSVPSMRLLQRAVVPGGCSMTGLALSRDETLVAASNNQDEVLVGQMQGNRLDWKRHLRLPTGRIKGHPYPCGICFSNDGRSLFVCASRSNELIQFSLDTGEVLRRIAVDPAPFAATILEGNTLAVTCWGTEPNVGQETADASGTEVPVDSRGLVDKACVDLIHLEDGSITRIKSALQPSNPEPTNSGMVIPAANGDQLEWFSPQGVTHIQDFAKSFGKMCSPTWVSYSKRRRELAVCIGRANEIAIYDCSKQTPRFLKAIQTAWYPCCVANSDQGWLVACAEGFGSRAGTKEAVHNVYEFDGALSLVPYSTPASARSNFREPHGEASSNGPQPVPTGPGGSSVFKHVVYVLKENRTYDQVFGDLAEADGSKALCDYPRPVTPNHHKIAREFAILDNYYCNGILSADGHAWAMEGNATSYFERTFGGWTRSYPFGDDPLSVSSTGFIWNDVLAHGRTFQNYGEFDYATTKPNDGWAANYRDYLAGGSGHVFTQNIGVKSLRPYSRAGYPGWNLDIPDQVRARIFTEDIHAGKPLKDFTIVYLPDDHTSGDAKGEPTPRACLADNDLALGKIVEAISHSADWKDTVIFVNEDDPQAGYDHVDGHRSLCLVVSPYTVRRRVVSEFYNQTSVLHTIEQILGIPPMNRLDAEAPLMSRCFTTVPDFTPYDSVPNEVPLDEMNPGPGHKLSFRRPDQNDERAFNEILWHANHPTEPIPSTPRESSALRAGRLNGDDR